MVRYCHVYHTPYARAVCTMGLTHLVSNFKSTCSLWMTLLHRRAALSNGNALKCTFALQKGITSVHCYILSLLTAGTSKLHVLLFGSCTTLVLLLEAGSVLTSCLALVKPAQITSCNALQQGREGSHCPGCSGGSGY